MVSIGEFKSQVTSDQRREEQLEIAHHHQVTIETELSTCYFVAAAL
jgi:hypothetical protein